MSSVARANAPSRAARPGALWGRWGLRSVVIAYLGVAIALPLAAVFARGFEDGPAAFWSQVAAPPAWNALKLTLWSAALITVINAILGTLTAYVLARYEFPGRRIFNALIDLPFAIPTLVTGVMLVVLYGPQGFIGAWFESRDMRIIFAKPGIVLALLLVSYPFIIRAVEPVLIGTERSAEEAAWTLGASRWSTFLRLTLPSIAPALLTGSLLCFARALGEFGSIVVVAGNIPGKTLTAPVYIYGEIESQNPRGASAVSIILLALSFGLLFAVDWFGRRRAMRRA